MHRTLICVVCAVSRPEYILPAISNFNRQAHEDKFLLLVLNGKASSFTTLFGGLPCNIGYITSETGFPSIPRNAGLAWAKARKFPYVCFWDDDDYYGRWFLTETAIELRKSETVVTGKCARYTRFEDGVYYLLGVQECLLGGTLAGTTSVLPPFPNMKISEDLFWCRNLRENGFEVKELSGLHYMYNRTGSGHAWSCSKTLMLYNYGPYVKVHRADNDVVETRPIGQLIEKPTFEELTLDLVEQQKTRLILEGDQEKFLVD